MANKIPGMRRKWVSNKAKYSTPAFPYQGSSVQSQPKADPNFDKYGNYVGPEKPDKGHKGGSCNRSACQAPGAVWYNHSTQRYYCTKCARMLNREAMAYYRTDSFLQSLGHDLCTLDTEAATDAGLI